MLMSRWQNDTDENSSESAVAYQHDMNDHDLDLVSF